MWIFEPEWEVSACRACGALIVWAITTQGAKAPLVAGFTILERKTIKQPSGVEVEILSVPAKASHFADCPQANQFRKAKK